jgi:hypothetical protein
VLGCRRRLVRRAPRLAGVPAQLAPSPSAPRRRARYNGDGPRLARRPVDPGGLRGARNVRSARHWIGVKRRIGHVPCFHPETYDAKSAP